MCDTYAWFPYTVCVFFVQDTATTASYTYRHTRSLRVALPICPDRRRPAFDRAAAVLQRRGRVDRRHHGDPGHEAGAGSVRRDRVGDRQAAPRSEEHTSELQSLMRISYAVFCLNKKKKNHRHLDPKYHSDMMMIITTNNK